MAPHRGTRLGVLSRFTDDTIQQVRSAADLVELASAHTDLRRQGDRYTGLCPFHEERSPSFSVNAADKLYYCFGCGAGGDLFDFVMNTESVDFPAAVELLADRYGIEITREREDPAAERRRAERVRLAELLERTAAFYGNVLRDSPEARKARSYLAGRGLTTAILEKFGVGYAPSAWDTLLVRSMRAGYRVPELERAGLLQRGRQGGHYDRFRGRITFPIRDARDRVIGFGARAMRPEQKPKYLNSAEGEIFHKSDVLYGIDLARWSMGKAGRAILVEGYTDVIALHQAGLTETVAAMGTSVTESQLAQLSARVDTVVLALDADTAGRQAMIRAGEIAARRRLRILVASMPTGTDPAEMVVSEGGEDRFRALVDSAVDLSEFHLDLILAGVDGSSPQDRDRGLGEAAGLLAMMPDGAARQELVRRAAERLGIDPGLVVARAGEASRSPGTAGDDPRGQAPPPDASRAGGSLLTKRERTERSLLAMCVSMPQEGRQWLDRLDPKHLSSPLMVRAVAWLRDHLEDPATGLDPDDAELRRLIAALTARSDPSRVGRGSIRRNFMELELLALEDEIRAAADRGDDRARAALIRDRSRLADEVRRAEDREPEA